MSAARSVLGQFGEVWFMVGATAQNTAAAAPAPVATASGPKMGPLRAFWEFCRPHTIIGTTLAVVVFYVIAATRAGTHNFKALALTYAASLALNIYIVGINQLTDVEIDKINKPYLPVASGAFSFNTGRAIVALAGVLCFVLAALQSTYLITTIGIIFALGTVYSLPPLRLKERPFFAATAITLARAIVGNLGVFLTFSEAMNDPSQNLALLPPHVIAFVAFMFGFVIVIALMKDVPDIEGDRMHDIATFVVKAGPKKIMTVCRLILTTCYTGMIIAGALGIEGVHPVVLIATHVIGLLAVWGLALRTDDGEPEQSYRYYMWIWKLFYFEFIMFPVACLLA